MKYNVKFILEQRKDKKGVPDSSGELPLIVKKVPIFADIRYSGTRIYYFIGYRLDAANFDIVEQEARKNTSGYEGNKRIQYNEINKRIRKIKAELELFFADKSAVPDKVSITHLLDESCKKSIKAEAQVLDFFELFEKYLGIINISEGRKRHFKTVKNHWKSFEKDRKKPITFTNFSIDTLRDFERYLATNKEKPKGRNTLHSILKMSRSFWSFAQTEMKSKGVLLPDLFGKDGYKIPAEVYGRPIYITDEERDLIYAANLEEDRLKWVRDIFIFQCHVGARVGDLFQFTKANVNNGVLSYIARKTKDHKPVSISIPLTDVAKEILSRYDLPDGKLLPFRSTIKYNEYLKDLFEKVGLTRIVTRPNPTTREPENVRICDIASSHMARRTFIGNKYGKISDGVITSMTGHVSDSRSLTRYYDVSDELKRKALGIK